MRRDQGTRNREQGDGEQGYLLLGALVAVAIVLIFLSVAAVDVARDLRREREDEAVRRARQYIRAIQLYYRKFGHYPGSIDQLEHTNNIRFLRKKYVDPLTGTTDWRLITVGKNKTTVKGFFGQPLAGLATTGLGALAGAQSPGIGSNTPGAGATTGAVGPGTVGAASAGATGTTGTVGATAPTAGATGTATAASTGTAAGTGTAAAGTGTTAGSTGSTNSPFGSNATGMFMGVGTNATGNSIIEVNEQKAYEGWEFLYDPRLEQLKQAAALNSGVGSTDASKLGQPASSTNPASPTAPGTAAPTNSTTNPAPAPTGTGTQNQP